MTESVEVVVYNIMIMEKEAGSEEVIRNSGETLNLTCQVPRIDIDLVLKMLLQVNDVFVPGLSFSWSFKVLLFNKFQKLSIFCCCFI